MKDNTILILLAVAAVGYFLYKNGFSSSVTYAGAGDKYTAYAQQLQGLANNATANFLGVHSAISGGINDQVNRSVDTALGSITNWANMAQQNRANNDTREHDQFMQYLQSINS